MDFFSLVAGFSLFFVTFFFYQYFLFDSPNLTAFWFKATKKLKIMMSPKVPLKASAEWEPGAFRFWEWQVMCYSVHFLPLVSLKDGKTILSFFFFLAPAFLAEIDISAYVKVACRVRVAYLKE